MSDNQVTEIGLGEMSVVGKRVPILEAVAKVRGEAKYVGDMWLPGMLYGKILRSPHPHANILGIDATKAKSLHGVKAVITSRDVPFVKYNSAERFYGQLATIPANEAIFSDKARYVGDRVAAVAATSEEIAERALDLISVRYEELPFVLDPEEALREGAPAIHEGGNLTKHAERAIGDVDKGFKESDLLFEGTFRTQAIQHCPMETHGSLATFEGGRVT
ncbi:MAG TPA: molybdopterin cofactor-binding domain-containing protein, partial [Candidatus Bathyarchaeia archaeon]|nr:molybdopterin cofactor-binding domain-containing protein [Candidatus Bathyarchaeia archaeon]